MITPYRIILADDHRLMRQGIRRIIVERPEMEVVGEAGDGLELLNLLKEVVPDMVIVDISMPRLRGIEATREIKSKFPHVKILILSMHKSKEYLLQAFSAGADGYLLKEDADSELYSAVETIRQNAHYISPILSMEVQDSFIQMLHNYHTAPAEVLTTREAELLTFIAEGHSSKEIALLLGISVRTAENHRKNIMRKLGMNKDIQLVRYAISRGYIPAVI